MAKKKTEKMNNTGSVSDEKKKRIDDCLKSIQKVNRITPRTLAATRMNWRRSMAKSRLNFRRWRPSGAVS